MSKLLIDIIPFSITPTQINESISNNNGRLIVEGVLQRAEDENQNGRIYPTGVLKREVLKYKGREIKENRAFGELRPSRIIGSGTKKHISYHKRCVVG
jgi:hypothetical protein